MYSGKAGFFLLGRTFVCAWECECVWYIYLAFKHLALLSFVAILEAMGT